MVIDVREPFEYMSGHVPDAEAIPMGWLAARLADLPRGVPVHLICASGNRNVAVASYLTRAGVDARPVAGGTDARWRAGHPTVRGRHVSA